MNLKDLRVVFAGCARNCSSFLPKVLDNIEFYSSFFSDSYMIIVENGSTDKTKEILKNNQNKKNFFLFEDDLNKLPYRGQRLEKARNLIIETIKKNTNLISCDLFIMLDLDDIGTYRIEKKNILDSVKFLFSKERNCSCFCKSTRNLL
jgi:glycosyltransferase involved in cell wall biosynthesis